MMKVKKAIIPVAGLGTRMLPATKAIPKEMLPIVDKPLIQYIVDECAAAGITDIVLVTHSSKNAIENHFDTSYELESMLEKRVKRQQLDEVQSITPKGVTIMHVRQGNAKGLGHAIMCAYPLVGDEPCAVILPDVLIDEDECDFRQDNLAFMLRQFEVSALSQILVEAVPEDKVHLYGIVDLHQVQLTTSASVKIHAVIEKPAIEDAPSNLQIVGRYVFSPRIWSKLKHTPPDSNGEVQLTDAIDLLMQEEVVQAALIRGQSHDCGNKLGYLKTNFLYAIRRDEFKELTQLKR